MTGRGALGVALLLTLAIAAQVAPGGEAALIGGVLVLVLISVPQPPRRQGTRLGHDLRGLLPVLALVAAAALAFVELFFLSLQADPGAGLAWFARALCLGALAALPRTPAAGLVLHGLVVVLSLWTLSALQGDAWPSTGGLVLGIATVALTTHGLLLGRSEELRSTAEGSVTTGVAPTPWGLGASRAPALLVALATLLPLALGLTLPRLPRGAGHASDVGDATVATSPPAGAQAPKGSTASITSLARPTPPSAPRKVEFTPQLDLSRGRSSVSSSKALILEVRARPAPPVLLLRGAALSRPTRRGWFRPDRTLTPPPLDPNRRWVMDLAIEQHRPQHGALFAIGRPVRVEGVRARLDRGALVVQGRVKYPLTYRVACRYDPGLDGDWPAAFVRPELVRLPPSLARDVRLKALARRVAVGRTAHLRAQAVTRWLRNGFVYDLKAPRRTGLGLHGLLSEFLHRTRRGVCEEFAMAMATLLRLTGVPARVAVGYRAEERAADGAYLVRARDAHAWVEVAYKGAGWVSYDPTPPSVFRGNYRPPDAQPRPRLRPPPPSATPSPTPTAPPTDSQVEPTAATNAAIAWPSWGTPLIAILVCGVGLLALRLGHRRLLLDVRAAQLGRHAVSADDLLPDRARLFALLAKRGFRLDGAETPLAFVGRLRAQGALDADLEEAVAVYTRLRFSGLPDPDGRSILRRCLSALGW